VDDSTRIVIKGISPYDGEYELDPERAFNTREWSWIKKVAGYMPMTITDGLEGGDPELFVALAVIAMCRAGKIDRDKGLQVAEALVEAPFDGATISIMAPEVDEGPLSLSTPDEHSPKSSPLRNDLSGEPSRTSSALSDETPSVTGTSGSDTWPTLEPTELVS